MLSFDIQVSIGKLIMPELFMLFAPLRMYIMNMSIILQKEKDCPLLYNLYSSISISNRCNRHQRSGSHSFKVKISSIFKHFSNRETQHCLSILS